MSITWQPLSNVAYGFPRGATRRIVPKVLAVVHITANLADAQHQRDYANRANSDGPSAHYYIDRDGGGIHAIDEKRYAAWSNGDLKSPKLTNAGVRYLDNMRPTHNANEGCYLEIECVGEANFEGQWTDAQFATVAALIADASIETGLPIDTETVLPHAYINTIDRAHCPSLTPAAHIKRLIEMANAEAGMGLEFTLPAVPMTGTLTIAHGADAIHCASGAHYIVPTDVARPAYVAILAGGLSSSGFLVDLDGDVAHFIRASEPVSFAPSAPLDCGAAIAAAITADRARARITYSPGE